MATRGKTIGEFLALATLMIGALWQLAGAQQADGPQAGPPEIKSLSDLTPLIGGEERLQTHLSTDKPIYRPGETLYARGVLLDARSNKPFTGSTGAVVQIVGPKGDVVASGPANSAGNGAEEGVLAFSWTIPSEQPGGEYTIKSRTYSGDAPAERKFDIRAYRAPRLRSQIEFLRDGYGPGEEVAATLEVSRAEGGVPTGARVSVIARVDGQEAYRGEATVDAAGRAAARFNLPAEIARSEGSLAMIIEDGGVLETAAKSIPILLQTVDLSLYPEGGQLVGGFENRVYIEAFTPARKPADLAGVVTDGAGREVASFRSEHEGRGRFGFTPQAGEKYTLRVTEPAGIRTTYPLPEVASQGVVLSAPEDTFGGRVRLRVASTEDGPLVVTLGKRDEELSRKELQLAAGERAEVTLSAGESSGVLIATVWDAEGKPLAERLVFSRPRKEVRIQLSADRSRYVPGGKAVVKLTTTDEAGRPTPAVVGLTVTDDSVLEMIERREQAPRLPVMVLLEPEVKELADAHVYLDPANDAAPVAVDLLLGTQGWRRFAYVDFQKFVEQHGDAALRSMAVRIPRLNLRGGFGGGGGFGDGEFFDDSFFKFRGVFTADALPAHDASESGVLVREEEQLNGTLAIVDQQQQADDKLGPAIALAPPRAASGPPIMGGERDRRDGPVGGRQALDEIPGNEAAEARWAGLAIGQPPAGNDFVAVRVFAHQVRQDRQPGERRDFTETLFWHAGLKTDDSGEATFEFDLSDAVTSFRVFADAFTADGALGAGSAAIESVEPFYVEPKLPLEVTSGDIVLAPLGVVNGTDQPQSSTLAIRVEGHERGDGGAEVALPADGRERYLAQLPIGDVIGPAEVSIDARAGGYHDTVRRTIAVKPLGFPIERGGGGLLEVGGAARQTITIPDSMVAGSLSTKAVVYPTPLANMTEALARLIQEPYGCFEQTSSTIFPLVMAQQYFKEHHGVDPELVARSEEMLAKGYERLVGFESSGGGYEWFGADPGHDALTAFGLLEFVEMSRVRNVDAAMLARTKKWFLAQRDGNGGYTRRATTLHTWLPEPEVANVYNTWAALEASIEGDFTTEVNWVRQAATKSENTYVLALAANVLVAAGDEAAAEQLRDKLAARQQPSGAVDGATMSVVGSGGEALEIETTALAALAWLSGEKYDAEVEASIRYLAEACKAGRFGSTQSTVLALKAILAYDRSRATPRAPGELQLVVDGAIVGGPVAFTTDSHGAIELPDFSDLLTPGEHTIDLQMTDGSPMPFSIAVAFHAITPDSSADCPLRLSATLAETRVAEGELTEARVRVVNRRQEIVPSPIAIIGIPGGLEVRHDQLKELVREGRIATYELLGRDLVLYWRSLAAGEEIELPVSLVAAIPGRYTGPASRAYLYYTDEHKTWSDGIRVDITPRQ